MAVASVSQHFTSKWSVLPRTLDHSRSSGSTPQPHTRHLAMALRNTNYKTSRRRKNCLKMADKKPRRNVVPLECTQSPAKPDPLQETWSSLLNFSPEREHRHQPPSRTSRRAIDDENVPPPGTQPRRSGLSPVFKASMRSSMVSTQGSKKLKVSRDCFRNDPL